MEWDCQRHTPMFIPKSVLGQKRSIDPEVHTISGVSGKNKQKSVIFRTSLPDVGVDIRSNYVWKHIIADNDIPGFASNMHWRLPHFAVILF